MYYVALFVFLTVSTVVGWFAIDKIMSGTQHIPTTFNIEPSVLAENSDTNVINVAEFGDEAANQQEFDESVQTKIVIDSVLNPAVLEPATNDDAVEIEVIEEEPQLAESEQTETPNQAITLDANEEQEENALRADSGGASKDDEDEDGAPTADKPQVDKPKIKKPEPRKTQQAQKEITEKKSVRALDLAYAVPNETNCVIQGEGYPKVGVFYRATSASIKGASLNNMDKLIRLYIKCGGGKLILLKNPLQDEAESNDRLSQRRQDEIKYYLIQRRIPKEDIIFPDNS